jgi:hypothetical protein
MAMSSKQSKSRLKSGTGVARVRKNPVAREYARSAANFQRFMWPVPKYSNAQLARKVAASEGFVRKWHQQLQDASGDEMTNFTIRSRCRKSSPRQVTAALEAKILHVREIGLARGLWLPGD